MIDTEYTNEITCPYCGYEDGDSWEAGPSSEETWSTDCGNCGRIIVAQRNIEVTYCTSKPTALRHALYGAESIKCPVCGESGTQKMVSDICNHFICADCYAKGAVCCDAYRQVLEQIEEES